MRKWGFAVSTVLVVVVLLLLVAHRIVPVLVPDSLNATTRIALRGLEDALRQYPSTVSSHLAEPSGSDSSLVVPVTYEGVTEAKLAQLGWSRPANLRVEIWIEGEGEDFSILAQDIRGGSQYSVTSSGTFAGNAAGNIGEATPQPMLKNTVAAVAIHDLDTSLDGHGLAAFLAAGQVSVRSICAATLQYPGTKTAGAKISDQSRACQAILGTPDSSDDSAIMAIRSNDGAAILAYIALDFVGDGTKPAVAPAWVTAGTSRPMTGRAPSATLPDFWRIGHAAERLTDLHVLGDPDGSASNTE